MSLRVLVLEAIYLVRQLKADQYNIYSYVIFLQILTKIYLNTFYESKWNKPCQETKRGQNGPTKLV